MTRVADALASLVDALPAGVVTSHHGEVAVRAHDRWALAMLRDLQGDRVPPPSAVAFPRSAQDVSTVLAWATETRTSVVVRGAGTGRAGGAQSLAGCVLLDMTRMNRILSVDDVSQTIRAEAGARLGDLETAASARGMWLGARSDGTAGSTLGGAIARGEPLDGGSPMRERILAITVTLSDGRVLGARSERTSAGWPDASALIAAFEGGAGVIVEATASLSREPTGVVWDVFRPHSFDAGSALVREISQRPFRPLVLRLFDPGAAGMAFDGFGEGHRPLLMVAGDTGAPGVEAERFELRELAKSFGARHIGQELGEHWWAHRGDEAAWLDAVMGAERALGDGVVADVSVAAVTWRRLVRTYDEVRGALLEYVERVGCRLEAPRPSLAALAFPFVVRASDDRDARDRYLAAWDSATRAASAAGARPVGEVGLRSLGWVRQLTDPDARSIALSVKAALDPGAIMNPGKVVPSPQEGDS